MNLPGYPFAALERKAAELRAAGRAIYNFSIGDPDLPPPEYVVNAARIALNEPQAHLYPSSRGNLEVRRSVARWFRLRFNAEVDPSDQVCILIGAKEGLSQIARAVVNRDDIVAVPEPAYPVYARAGCRLVEGQLRVLRLDPENGFLPDLKQAEGSRLVYLNYPNNPTGASATTNFLGQAADLAESDRSLTIAYDMAYSEVYFGSSPQSLLEFTPQAVEFHSLSKMANATGYRVGFAVGEPNRIAALVRVKEEMDSGVPYPFQMALKAALDRYQTAEPPPEVKASLNVYRRRKERLTQALTALGFRVYPSDAGFYVWFQVGTDEMDFISRALDKGILFTPGRGFGESGKGWVRASVTVPDDVLEQAVDILGRL
ncbi:MAG: aminotransferase class I/II-fold pyridoxal phosphate-dependent enzyme [Calditrichota bacterium]